MYIGSSAATGTPLTKLTSTDTGDYILKYQLPRGKFLRATNSYLPVDNAKLTLTIAFISDNAEEVKLAMGNLLTVVQQDQPPGNAIYSLFLLDSLHTSSSIWIPNCQTATELTINRSKKNQTQINLTFQYENRDNQVNLFYKRDNASLKTLMGSQSPI